MAEYQTSAQKEAIREQKEKTEARTAAIEATGNDKNTGAIGFGSLVDKIKSKQRKW